MEFHHVCFAERAMNKKSGCAAAGFGNLMIWEGASS
jgi:hypothetical protein